MKKKILLFVLCIFVLPLMFLIGGCSANKDIEIRVSGGYVQWSYQGENLWHDLIDTSSIKSMLGETYKGEKGDKGEQGLQGTQGIAGKQVEFRRTEQNIEWHYVGEDTWHILISVEELKTDNSIDTNPQQLAFYPLDDGTYGVGAGNATELSSITIPETYLGKPVTKIVDNGFENNSHLKSIDIPDSVNAIGNAAFYGCRVLTEIVLNERLIDIGEDAFAGCKLLTNITIPYGVKNIGNGAFRYCSSLVNLTMPDSVENIGNSILDGSLDNLQYNIFDNAKYLGNDRNPYLLLVKATDDNISKCDINVNTKFINSNAFAECKQLTSITIPNNITMIGRGAFAQCDSLTNAVFENTLGWTRFVDIYNDKDIDSSELNDSTKAAELLKAIYLINDEYGYYAGNRYCYYYWIKQN